MIKVFQTWRETLERFKPALRVALDTVPVEHRRAVANDLASLATRLTAPAELVAELALLFEPPAPPAPPEQQRILSAEEIARITWQGLSRPTMAYVVELVRRIDMGVWVRLQHTIATLDYYGGILPHAQAVSNRERN